MHPLINEFIEKKSKSKKWSIDYKSYITSILRTMYNRIEKDVKEIDEQDLNGFFHYQKETQRWISVSTVISSLKAIKQFFKYLEHEKIIEKSPARNIKYPKAPKGFKDLDIDAISDKEYRRQKKIVDSPLITDKQRAIWHIAVSTPLNAKYIRNIKREDLKLQYNRIDVDINGEILNILLIPSAIKAIETYLIKTDIQGEYLFPSKDGTIASLWTIRDNLLQIGRLADPDKKYSSRYQGIATLRKGDIIRYIESGADLYALKYQLGAKSFKILDNYAEVTSKRKVLIMKAHRRYQSWMRRRGMI